MPAVPVYDDQMALFGSSRVVGFARGPLTVCEMDRDTANAVIRANHYSGKTYAGSTVHLAVRYDDEPVGVLQYGFAMNPASGGSVVAGTEQDEYLELNRMWVDDRMPRNTETAALSLSMRYIKATRPAVAWIQSFADERCGGLGVVYQAASFTYCGEHTATFWEVDGEMFHNSLMTRDPSLTPAARYVQSRKDDAVAHRFRQFRYIKFLKPAFRSRLLLPVLPYPKRERAEGVEETNPALQPGSGGAMPSLRLKQAA